MGYDYILSFRKKQHIRKAIYLQFFLASLIVLQLTIFWAGLNGIKDIKIPRHNKLTTGVHIIDNIKLPRKVFLPNVPTPEVWQYVWLFR